MDDYDPNSILIEDALKKITKITKKIDSYEYVSLIESHDRILYENIKSKIIYYSVKNPKIYLALYLFQLDLEGGIVDLYYDVLAHFFYNKGAHKIIVIGAKPRYVLRIFVWIFFSILCLY